MKVSEIFYQSFNRLKRGLERAWEKVKENYLVVFAVIGLLPLFLLVMKYIGG